MKNLKLLFNQVPKKPINFRKAWVFISAAMVLVSLAVSATTDNWSWFQRSGSILALSGVTVNNHDFLLIKRLITVLTILGTLIWGYGDLIGQFVFSL